MAKTLSPARAPAWDDALGLGRESDCLAGCCALALVTEVLPESSTATIAKSAIVPSDERRNVSCVALACRLCMELEKTAFPDFNELCRLCLRDQTRQRNIEFCLPNVNRAAR